MHVKKELLKLIEVHRLTSRICILRTVVEIFLNPMGKLRACYSGTRVWPHSLDKCVDSRRYQVDCNACSRGSLWSKRLTLPRLTMRVSNRDCNRPKGWPEGGARLQISKEKRLLPHSVIWVARNWSEVELHEIDCKTWHVRKQVTRSNTWSTQLICIHILSRVIIRYQAWPLYYHPHKRWWANACNERIAEADWGASTDIKDMHSENCRWNLFEPNGQAQSLLFSPLFVQGSELGPTFFTTDVASGCTHWDHFVARKTWWTIW